MHPLSFCNILFIGSLWVSDSIVLMLRMFVISRSAIDYWLSERNLGLVFKLLSIDASAATVR